MHRTSQNHVYLFLQRLYALGVSEQLQAFGNQSLVDVESVCEEITLTGTRDLIRIPAFNQENLKGFLVFFIPPISDGQEPRKFHTGLIVPQEFAKSVGKGDSDKVVYSSQQLANDHRLKLKIRILVDTDLPDVSCQPEFGKVTVKGSHPEFDATSGRNYWVYECDVGETRVNVTTNFAVTIRKN